MKCPICNQELEENGECLLGCDSFKIPDPQINEIIATKCLLCNGTGYYGVAGAKCPCQRRTHVTDK